MLTLTEASLAKRRALSTRSLHIYSWCQSMIANPDQSTHLIDNAKWRVERDQLITSMRRCIDKLCMKAAAEFRLHDGVHGDR